MALLYSNGASNYIGVSNIDAAVAWYIEKLGLRRVETDLDDSSSVALGFAKDDYALCIGPKDAAADALSPRLNCSSANKASQSLASRGVSIGAIQQDDQGTQFFEMQDLEGNVVEIAEEP